MRRRKLPLKCFFFFFALLFLSSVHLSVQDGLDPGKIVSGVSSKEENECLYIKNNSKNGPLLLGSCEEFVSCIWSFDDDGKIGINDMCVTMIRKESVIVKKCMDTSKQTWAYSLFDRSIMPRSYPEVVLTVPSGATPNLSKIVALSARNWTVDQAWKINQYDTDSSKQVKNIFRIVLNFSSDESDKKQLYLNSSGMIEAFNTTQKMLWTTNTEGGFRPYLKNNKCLTKQKGYVVLKRCKTSKYKTQLWSYSLFDQNIFLLYNGYKVLSAPNETPKSGDKVTVADKINGVDRQKWTIEFSSTSASKEIYSSREGLSFTFHNLMPKKKSRLAIYPAEINLEQNPSESIMWMYTACASTKKCNKKAYSGELIFDENSAHGGNAWPLSEGEWKAFLINESFLPVAQSDTFIVVPVPSVSPLDAPNSILSKNPSGMPSDTPSNILSLAPSITSISPSSVPSTSPSLDPTIMSSSVPSNTPNGILSKNPSTAPFSTPSIMPSYAPSPTFSNNPSSKPTTVPTMEPIDDFSYAPSDVPSNAPSKVPNFIHSTSPTNIPSNIKTDVPTLFPSSPESSRATWMSGKHGVGYRIPGGINFGTLSYNAQEFANQIKDLPISYVIVGLSSGAFGDRYLSPHPIFTELGIRANTPKDMDLFKYDSNNPESKTVDLNQFEDIDVFDNLLTEMASIGVKVIAYMAAQGPAMLKAGESSAFDHPDYTVGFNTGGYLSDNSVVVCKNLGAVSGKCSPTVRKWINWVADQYNISPYNFEDAYVSNSGLQMALKHAYSHVILEHYVERYGSRIAGFWFDQGEYGNKDEIFSVVRKHNPAAVIAYNYGAKIPLRNNNPAPTMGSNIMEDFTFGHMTPHKSGANPPDGCYNYGMILSVESSIDGYVYKDVTPSNDLSQVNSNPYLEDDFSITYQEKGTPSLAHVYLPFQEYWNSGDLVWNDRQAAEWMHRVITAKGAFTWAVRRSGCAGCSGTGSSQINPPDLEALKRIYSLLPITDSLQYNSTNCDCLSEFGTTVGWGCAYDPPPDQCQNEENWTFSLNGKPKNCNWVCKACATAPSNRCKSSYKSTNGKTAIEACTYCCNSDCDGYC